MHSDRVRAAAAFMTNRDLAPPRRGRSILRTPPAWGAILLAATIVLPLEARAAVYKCKGADGSTVFADAPCGADAQVLEVRTPPPVSDTRVPAQGRGGRSTARDEAAACWLPKYTGWQTQNPRLAANSSVNLQTMQRFQNECHWTPRMRGAVAAAPAPLSAAPGPTPPSEGSMSVSASRAAVASGLVPLAGAAGGIDGYLSDAHLLESRQSAAPGVAIRYSDPVNGALLKSVLDPARAMSELDAAMRQHDTRRFDALRHLIQPMQERYAQAFASHPHVYEAEYLDTLDIGAAVIRHMADRMRTASRALPPAATASGDARLDQNLASLNQSMNGMLATLEQAMAKGIRQQVGAGKFSPAGVQRATRIADSLSAS
jgi:hypothetical protein